MKLIKAVFYRLGRILGIAHDYELYAFDLRSKKVREQVEFRQISNMKSRSNAVVLTRTLLGLVVAGICWDAVPVWLLILWLAFGVMHMMAWLKSTDDFFSSGTAFKDLKFWKNRTAQMSAVSGLFWGFTGYFFMATVSPFDQMLVLCIIVGIAFASIPLYAWWVPATWCFMVPALLPTLTRVFAIYGISLVSALYVLVTMAVIAVFFALRLSQVFTQSIVQSMEREHLMEELIQQRQKADFARAAAELAIVNRTRFFAAANHDLRQPLQAMGIFINLLESQVNESARPLVENLSKACSSVATLVDSILTISKLEAGSLKTAPTTFNLADLFEELSIEFTQQAANKGLEFTASAPSVWVKTDEALFGRILRNLITNAIRYSDKGRVLLRAKETREGRLVITVSDQGRGMSREDQSKVFSEFFRGASAGGAKDGFGLGLSIVKRISELLGIKLVLRSRIGRGTIFRLEMPIVAEREQIRVLRDVQNDYEIKSLKGAYILLIEDDPLIRTSIEALLDAWGARVMSAERFDAELPVRILGEDPIDFILTDFNLGAGTLTGLQAVFRIRSAVGRSIPALIMTAVPRETVLEQYEQESVDMDFSEKRAEIMALPAIIQKPVTPRELNRIMARGISKGNGTEEA
jgi:signal transduction histidine kinase/CheY-like chemotaxis protein